MTEMLDERLPTPKLDDRRFQDLVDEAKRRVQQRCPEWTDHNVSDPGVTLIETFAWMTDQLLYRLNRVPDLNYVKFLELLDVKLLPPTAARAALTFRLAKAQPGVLDIPAGTQVSTPRNGAGEQITFATLAPLPIVPCAVDSLAGTDSFGAVRSHDDTLRIVCFSARPEPGDALLIGLSTPVPSCMVKLELPCKKSAGGGIAPDDPPLAWDARVGDDDGTVTLWNQRTRERFSTLANRGQTVRRVAFSPDGHMLASAGDGSISLRDAHEPKAAGRRLDGHDGAVRALSFSEYGKVLASAGDDGDVWLWAIREPDQPGRRVPTKHGQVFAVAFDHEGKTLASAGADGTVQLWDVATATARQSLDVHEYVDEKDPDHASSRRCVIGVSFLGTTGTLGVVADDRTLWVWDPENPTAPSGRALGGERAGVFGAAFSADGRWVATAGDDWSARVWSVEPPASGELEKPRLLKGHQGAVYTVAFSRDGKTVGTVGADWTARLWDPASGEQLQRPLSDHCPVHDVAFHPLGELVATAAFDGGWVPCEVESDGTLGLNEPASVVLHVPEGHTETTVGTKTAGWLRCRVRAHAVGQSPYDKSPVIDGECKAETIGGTVTALNAEIVLDEVVGVSEGVAGQRFALRARPVVPMPGDEKHVLVVGRSKYEWHEVDSFERAGKKFRWFAVDYAAGQIVFGPTVRERDAKGVETLRAYGAVPRKGAPLILRKYMAGGGRRGNVKERTLTVLRTPIANVVSVENRCPGTGGVDGEDIENAKLRAPITLRTANRAVTAEDYEQLAREAAPELARVECIAATDLPDEGAAHEGEARVLVIPRVEGDNGELRFEQLVPTVEMVTRIKAYLDRRRVIGARILVAPPYYHGITIAAKLLARREFDAGDVKERALAALYEQFSPVSGGRHGDGWEFGRPVLHGDVYAVLQSVPGVDRVDNCRLFEANPITGERTPVLPQPGEHPHALGISVSRYATVFSYRHYLYVEGQ